VEHVAGRTTRAGPAAAIRAAVGLLTRLPVGTVADEPGAAAFAAVGTAVGLLGAVPVVLLGLAGEPVLGAIAAIGTIAAVSGGLHLDGLADTADAMLAPSPPAAEYARKDPAIGPGGAAAMLIVLGLQIAALASVSASSGAMAAGAIVVVGGAVSRWLPVLAVVLFRRRLAPYGLGAWFGAHASGWDAAIGAATVIAVTAIASLVVGSSIAIAAAIGVALAIAGTALVARARGRLDGDGLGLCVEIALAATVVSLAVIA
jgi:adenosylcobinamide-GDP ribazoletransferase